MMFICRWCTRKPGRTEEEVPIPSLRGDEWHCMTVLPYLNDHYYGDDSDHERYITEHELNGIRFIFTNF